MTPPLRIPVPLGTVVKRRRGGALLGELLRPGQTLVVARGGSGGAGVVAPAKRGAARNSSRRHQVSGLISLCSSIVYTWAVQCSWKFHTALGIHGT